jgi:drug/metabolite transporter (DMT)-like permease
MKNPPTHALPSQGRARALLVGMTVLWGTTFPVIRGLQLAQHRHGSRLSDEQLAAADTAVRFGLAAIVLLLFFGRQLFSITRREWSQASGLALFAGLGLYLQTLGLAWTDASISAFLTQFYILLIPLFMAWRYRRRPSNRIITACLMVLAGTALLSPGLLRHFILGPGELITLLSSVFFAAQIIWVERPVYAQNRSGC